MNYRCCPVMLFVCACLLSLDPELASTAQRLGATNLSPRISYEHPAADWWTNSMVHVPQGAVLSVYHPFNEAHLLEEVRWSFPANSSNENQGSVIVREGDSFQESVGHMVESFASRTLFSNPLRASGEYANLGDCAYLELANPYAKAIDFVRNNVFVSIYSSDLNWTTNTAFAIDAAILNASTNTASRSRLQRLLSK